MTTEEASRKRSLMCTVEHLQKLLATNMKD